MPSFDHLTFTTCLTFLSGAKVRLSFKEISKLVVKECRLLDPLVGFHKIYRATLWFQGIYTALTALWALIDIDSFMAVTGPKTDIWLVKTVSVVLLAVGAGFIAQALVKSNPLPVVLLALTCSIGLCSIDIYYAFNNVISNIYLADAFLQILFMAVWIYTVFNLKNLPKQIYPQGRKKPS